ncbi:MAG: Uma2 family endonuclease [Mobilicoccus sp.]|nr:Uma2 family endonuclease [Mobilicoccus sp.]
MTSLPVHHTWTVDDLDHTPDDGNRYELIDGTLIVTPAPVPSHQRASMRLAVILVSACPPGCEVFAAPLDVRLAGDTAVQPDLLVVDPANLTDRGLAGPPLLAVEILSPSTRLIDLNLKKARYEVARCPSYWIIDPGLRGEPSITAWQLEGDHYTLAGTATGKETLHLTAPFPLDLTPAALTSRRG